MIFEEIGIEFIGLGNCLQKIVEDYKEVIEPFDDNQLKDGGYFTQNQKILKKVFKKILNRLSKIFTIIEIY